MEFLLLLLLPLLGTALGDSAADEDDAEADDTEAGRQAASHDSADADEEASEDAPESDLPGGDHEDTSNESDPPHNVVTVQDFDGGTETLTLQVDADLLESAKAAPLTATTDDSGDVTLALAGHDIALLTQPRGFDLSLVSLAPV